MALNNDNEDWEISADDTNDINSTMIVEIFAMQVCKKIKGCIHSMESPLHVILQTPSGARVTDVSVNTLGELREQAKAGTGIDPLYLVAVNGNCLVQIEGESTTPLSDLTMLHDGCAVHVHSSKTISELGDAVTISRTTRGDTGKTNGTEKNGTEKVEEAAKIIVDVEKKDQVALGGAPTDLRELFKFAVSKLMSNWIADAGSAFVVNREEKSRTKALLENVLCVSAHESNYFPTWLQVRLSSFADEDAFKKRIGEYCKWNCCCQWKNEREETLDCLRRALPIIKSKTDPKLQLVLLLLVDVVCAANLIRVHKYVEPILSPGELPWFLPPNWGFVESKPDSILPICMMLEALYDYILPPKYRFEAVEAVSKIWSDLFVGKSTWWKRIPVHLPRPLCDNMTLISFAASVCDWKTYEWIHSNAIHKCDTHTATPLYMAIRRRNVEVVRHLLPPSLFEEEIDVSDYSYYNNPIAFQYQACTCAIDLKEPWEGSGEGDPDCFAGSDKGLMHVAIQSTDVEIVKLLLEKKLAVCRNHLVVAVRTKLEIFRAIFESSHNDSRWRSRDIKEVCDIAANLQMLSILGYLCHKFGKEVMLGIACTDSVESARFVLSSHCEPTGAACYRALTLGKLGVFQEMMKALLKCQFPEVKRECFHYEAANGDTLLHAICKHEDLEFGRAALAELTNAMRSLVMPMDHLNEIRNKNGKIAMDEAKDAVLENMRALFPAQAAWKSYEIPESELHLIGDAAEFVLGGSKARVQLHWYGIEACKVVVKRYPRESEAQMKREFGIASLLHFPSLPRLLGRVNFGGSDPGFGIVVEVYGQNMWTRLRRTIATLERQEMLPPVTLVQKIKWARQVGAALRYLHSRLPPITHGDVHASNVLLTSGDDAVLCDFDCSCIEGAHARTFKKMALFPRFPDTFHKVNDLKRVDWLMFGFLLLSFASDGKWDWRIAQKELVINDPNRTKLSKEEFLNAVKLGKADYNAAGYFLAIAFEDVVGKEVDDSLASSTMVSLHEIWTIMQPTLTPESSPETMTK